MKRKVILEGQIADKFGKEFTINAKSFADVVKCLDMNFPEFRGYLLESESHGIGFICEVAGSPVKDERELLLQYPEGTMTISAVPAGSKSGGAKILAAAVIVGLVAFGGALVLAANMGTVGGAFGGAIGGISGGLSAGLSFASGTLLGQLGIGLAINLALTGLQQMMAPDPSIDNQQDESYLFQGTTQEAVEGDPVPILYGKLRIPGRPISSQIKNERQAFVSLGGDADTPTPPAQDSGSIPVSQSSIIGLGQTQKFNLITVSSLITG